MPEPLQSHIFKRYRQKGGVPNRYTAFLIGKRQFLYDHIEKEHHDYAGNASQSCADQAEGADR